MESAAAERYPLGNTQPEERMRPTGLTGLTLIMCVLNLTGFLFVAESGATAPVDVPGPFMVAGIGFFILAGYVVLWYFWQGRNWARWLVLLTSVLALLNLGYLPSASGPQRVVIVIEAVLGAYLLFWLNTGPARAFFAQGGSFRVA